MPGKLQRERAATAGWLLFGLLLLGLLVWSLLQYRGTTPRLLQAPSVIALVSLPPPPPPPPREPQPQRMVKAPPAPAPAPTRPSPRAPTAPKSKAPAVEQPLAIDSPADADPLRIPQGLAAGSAPGGGGNGGNGFTIGGGGGGGGGCSGLIARSYATLVNAKVARTFQDERRTDGRQFQVGAKLWFDPTGGVERTILLNSSGKDDLDAIIIGLLQDIHVDEHLPPCVQPVTVRVSKPWNGSFDQAGGGREPAGQDATSVWIERQQR